MIQRPPATIVALSAADIHPPGYYLLLAAWAGLAGTSEFGLRALSALESVLTVVPGHRPGPPPGGPVLPDCWPG